MALGAGAPRIFGLVLSEGAAIVGVGAVLGLAGAAVLRRTLESVLYGVGALDSMVLAIVGAVMIPVALLACIIPARRAARTDPTAALAD
jgi:ABC-type antimicrobial peptide transport system permease subunit